MTLVDRSTVTPFMERHLKISLALVMGGLVLLAAALGIGLGNLGASLVDMLAT